MQVVLYAEMLSSTYTIRYMIHRIFIDLFGSLDLFGQFGNRREQIRDEAGICNLEDGSVGILKARSGVSLMYLENRQA